MILALDVALRFTGWVVLTEAGELRDLGWIENPAHKMKNKYQHEIPTATYCVNCSVKIARELTIILKKWSINTVTGELPTGGAKSAAAMRGMALATASVAASLWLLDRDPVWTTPREGKLAACNDAHASKEDMIRAMQNMFHADLKRLNVDMVNGPKKYEHIADALASYLASIKS